MTKEIKILIGGAITTFMLTVSGCSAADSLEERAVDACKVFENNDYKSRLDLYSPKSRVLQSYKMGIKNTYDGDVDAWAEAKKQKDIKKGKVPKAGDFDCSIVEIKGKKGESKQKVIMKKMFGDENHKMRFKRVDGKWYL